jgi:hypothetical protein
MKMLLELEFALGLDSAILRPPIRGFTMPDLTPAQIAAIQDRLKAENAEDQQKIAKRDELIRAYELVRQHQSSNGTSHPEIATHTHVTRLYAAPGYGYNRRIVRGAIDVLAPEETFTIKRIHEILTGCSIDLTIEAVTTVFNNLREGPRPYIRVITPGKGRRATVFQKA